MVKNLKLNLEERIQCYIYKRSMHHLKIARVTSTGSINFNEDVVIMMMHTECCSIDFMQNWVGMLTLESSIL